MSAAFVQRVKSLPIFVLLAVLVWSPLDSFADPVKLYLVRHAEKVDQSQDSALTELGESRAQAIANILEAEPLAHIFSTPFNRTLLTAKPAADFHELDIAEYDGNRLQEFAQELRLLEGVALVVGHSNTTPVLVNHLVGTELPLLQDHEYDRVYVVSIAEGGDAKLEMLYTAPRTP